MTGPRIGPRAAGRLTAAISRPTFCPCAACIRIVVISGIITPPPRPWTTRKAIRLSTFQAQAQSTEPSRNRVRATSHSRLAPSRLCAHPEKGIATNIASRYAVLTHWIVLTDAWSELPSSWIATLTIVVSRMTATAPVITAAAIRLSCGSSAGGEVTVAVCWDMAGSGLDTGLCLGGA